GTQLDRFALPHTAPDPRDGDIVPFAIRVDFGADGKTVIADDLQSKEIVVWDVNSGNQIQRLTPEGRSMFSRVSGDGRRLVAGSLSGSVFVWDLRTAQQLRTFEVPGTAPNGGDVARIIDLALNRNGTHLVTAGGDNKVRAWD